MTGRDLDIDPRLITREVWDAHTPTVVHACPFGDSAVTPCCERSPFDLPRTERMSVDDAEVTCPGRYVAFYGSAAVAPWDFVPCAREHEPDRVCILPDGHDRHATPTAPSRFDRTDPDEEWEAFRDTLIDHQRAQADDGRDGCSECGPLLVGSSFAEHLWDVYQAALPTEEPTPDLDPFPEWGVSVPGLVNQGDATYGPYGMREYAEEMRDTLPRSQAARSVLVTRRVTRWAEVTE